MEKFDVKFNKQVIDNDWSKLDSVIKTRIKAAVQEKLQVNPLHFGFPLKDSLKGHLKLRVGNYRIIYRILHKDRLVLIQAIDHRSVVYKVMRKRM